MVWPDFHSLGVHLHVERVLQLDVAGQFLGLIDVGYYRIFL